MDKKKLSLYYRYYIPITLLQIVASVAMMFTLTVNDYGQYSLYLTTINFFFFATFGLQNGYMLANRTQARNNTNAINSLNCLLLIIASAIFFLIAISVIIIGLNQTIIYIALAVLATTIYIFHKSIFRTSNDVHQLNIIILCFRLIAIIDIIIYLLTSNLVLLVACDALMRLLHVLLTSCYIYYYYASDEKINLNRAKTLLVRYCRLGLPIMVGNWIYSLTVMFDKMTIAHMPEQLGYYSFAITAILLLRTLLIPLNEMLFINVDINTDQKTITRSIRRVLVISFPFALILSVICQFVIVNLPILTKYIPALFAMQILLIIIALIIIIESILIIFIKLKKRKLFLLQSMLIASIFYVSLHSYVNYFEFSLNYYCILVVINFTIATLIYCSAVCKGRLFVVNMLSICFTIISYILIISYF